ncbi:hypothetical protein [Curtobacterium sp. YR515]|uniref:hypothetical protein n=1 Tax=Curtobacterium sp. YR515 TaxID=1855316 RepID=UPI0015870CCB|nr:hypothetical protein [Curtobacterium sp. YR515]
MAGVDHDHQQPAVVDLIDEARVGRTDPPTRSVHELPRGWGTSVLGEERADDTLRARDDLDAFVLRDGGVA